MKLKDMLDLADRISDQPEYRMLELCVENSRWHREPSVSHHTSMVCDWYSRNARREVSAADPNFCIGYIACRLHDIAKPVCQRPKYTEDRGHYFTCEGHDHVGARLAEEILVRLGVDEFDIIRISWMIAHHQIFWSVKKPEVMARILHDLRTLSIYKPFKMFMLADSFGRETSEPMPDVVKFFADFERKYAQQYE